MFYACCACSQATSHFASQRKAPKAVCVPWSEDEVMALREGVARYPPLPTKDTHGRQFFWSSIRNDPELRLRFHESRSGIDLKVGLPAREMAAC